ncbi:FtsX-like permease family protein [Myceligenerans cantabricum]
MTTTTTARSTGAAGTSSAGPVVGPQKRNHLPTARYTMAQMRRNTGRLTAAGIAIAIGTAFVAVTLLAGNLVTRINQDTVAARYADADVVVTTSGDATRQDLEAVRAADGVAAADAVQSAYVDLDSGDGFAFSEAIARSQDDRLVPLELAEGKWPSESGEIAVPGELAERLEVNVGDELDVQYWVTTDLETGEAEEAADAVRVSGITDDPYSAYAMSGGAIVAMPQDIEEWTEEYLADGEPVEIAAILDPSVLSGGEPTQETRDALASAVVSEGDTEVQTVAERAEEISAAQMGGTNLVNLIFVLAFAVVALVVAGLVISNTFQVLVAQRTRTLALLRAIGARKGQLYRSVLLEAAVLGVLASLTGLLFGLLLVQAALSLLPQFDVIDIPLPTTVPVSLPVVLVPIAAGTLVTLVAALAPARNATRVAPLAALRPAVSVSLRKGAGRVRAVFAALFMLGGFGALGLGTWLGMNDQVEAGLLLAVAGGSLSLIGVIMSAVFWLPRVAAFFGRLVGSTGASSRLAAANTLRNPRRTSATATALLIGVTLIMTMTTGAAAARNTANQSLDEQFPMDILVMAGGAELSQDTPARLGEIDVVDGVAPISAADVTLEGAPGGDLPWWLKGAEPAELRDALRDESVADTIAPGTILLSEGTIDELGISAGDTIDVAGQGETVQLTVAVATTGFDGFVSLDDLTRIAPEAQLGEVWATLDPEVDGTTGLADVQDSLNDESLYVQGPVAQRATFEQVINIMLGVIVGLLAVAVVIAVIGVANTLSLSVIERRRESATLRAIGLSKPQLRGMLAVEGMLIALVGAAVGIVLGMLYGWAGAASALSMMGEVQYTVPWFELTVVLVVALVAGLVASVAPARTALKASPVEALASE